MKQCGKITTVFYKFDMWINEDKCVNDFSLNIVTLMFTNSKLFQPIISLIAKWEH